MFSECGLVGQIENFLRELAYSRYPLTSKMRERTDFLDKFEEEMNKQFFEMNWEIFFAKYSVEELTTEIKGNITRLFDRLAKNDVNLTLPRGSKFRISEGINEWCNWLLMLDNILSYFLYRVDSKAYETEPFTRIYKYYLFLREETEKRHLLIPEPFNIKPLERFWQNQKSKPKRPSCIECDSSHVVSSGVNWLCRSCGRQFRKQKRRT